MVQGDKRVIPTYPQSGTSIGDKSTSSVPLCLGVLQVPSIFPEPPGLHVLLTEPITTLKASGLRKGRKVCPGRHLEGGWLSCGHAGAGTDGDGGGMIDPGCS